MRCRSQLLRYEAAGIASLGDHHRRFYAGLAAPRALSPAVLPAACPPSGVFVQLRSFAGIPKDSAEVEARVVKAVKRYLDLRQIDLDKDMEDLQKDTDEMKQKLEAKALLNGEVTVNSTWDNFDLDELDRVEVLLEIEEEFDLVIPDETADTISSAKEAVDYLLSQQQK